MFKKIIALILIFTVFPNVVYAVSENAEGCVLINADTRQILYNKNAFTKMGMASTTKIMTALVALENAAVDKVITVSENAQNQEGSSIYLRTGDNLTLMELLYGLMLNSGNDAAVAIAEGISGTCEEFVRLMNEKAKEVGCKKTQFKNPNGLSDSEHYSTAYDMALIMACAMENEAFKKIVSTKEYQIKNNNSVTYLRNHNKLLWQTSCCIGGKTGFTKTDGRCLVSCAEKDGKKLIAVTLDDRDDWKDHKTLFDYGFDKLKKVKIIDENEILCTKTVQNSKINLLSEDSLYAYLKSENRNGLSCKLFLSEAVNGEIYYGTRIGYADIYLDDYKIGRIGLISGQAINNKHINIFSNNFRYILRFMLLKKRTA